MKVKRRTRSYRRSQRGALGTLLLLLVLQLCFVAAAVSVDLAHQVSVRAEMQVAADAAAVAGEEIMLTTGANSSTAIAAAVSVWGKNYSDGKLLSANSKSKSVVTVGATSGTPSLPTIQVLTTVPVNNLFGSMIGHGSDTLAVSAVAGPGEVKTAFTAFPLTVINRNYQPNTQYTWYISDAPGLVPGLVNLLVAGLTGYSNGSTPPSYPNLMLGTNTARFLTSFNAGSPGGVIGLADGLLNGVGGPLGLGSPGTVLGGILPPTTGTTGSLLSGLLTGSNSGPGPDTAALSMLSYWDQNVSTTPGNNSFQLTANTAPSFNYGVFPSLPSTPLAPPALTNGQQVLVTTGANSATNNALDTTAQFMQGPTGNRPAGALTDTYIQSIQVNGPGLSTTPTATLQGSVASWLQGQTVMMALTNPSPVNSSITVPIIDINLLGVSDSTQSTYSAAATGLLGPIVQPLTGIGTASPTAAVVDRFIAVKINSVTVQYQGGNGLGLLGLSLLNNPWAQQVVRITGTVQPSGGGAGVGGSSHSSGNATSAYAAMLIQ